jgi:uncharacterized membrane protein YfcA
MNWNLLLSISALATAGIFLGNRLQKHISSERLRKTFGWFILLIGVFILAAELSYSVRL